MLKENINKELNPKAAAAVIAVVGIGFIGYLATQVDWLKFEANLLTIGLPTLFLLIVFLFAYLVIHPKKHQITSHKTDQKFKTHLDSFNQKTATIQSIISIISIVLIALIVLGFYFIPEQIIKWLHNV